MGIIEIFFENWTSIALRIISDLISRLVIVDFKSQAYMWDIAQSSIIHGPHDHLFHNQNQDNGCATNLTYCSDSHLNLILKKKKSKINQKERKKDLLSQSILSLKSNAPKKKKKIHQHASMIWISFEENIPWAHLYMLEMILEKWRC